MSFVTDWFRLKNMLSHELQQPKGDKPVHDRHTHPHPHLGLGYPLKMPGGAIKLEKQHASKQTK